MFSQGDIEAAQKSISKAIDVASDNSHQRGKYNSYSPEQRAGIGKYAEENGATRAAKYSLQQRLGYFYLNESTARRLHPRNFLQHHGLVRQSIVTRHCYLNH